MKLKKNYFHLTFSRRAYILAGVIALVTLAGSLFVTKAFAADTSVNNDERLITIHDSGNELTIVTRALTVRDALKQAEVNVSEADIVEPAQTETLVAHSYQVNVFRARPIVVKDGMHSIKVMTAEQSPRQIVKAANLTLYDEDTTKLERVNDVLSGGGAGLTLTIERATVFSLTLYGKTFEARSQATTVGGLLKEKNIKLGTKDGVSPTPETQLASGMSVRIWRNGKQTITTEEVITKPVEEVKDTALEVGTRQLKTGGTDGKRNATYEIETKDGVEISRKEIASVTILEPVKEIVIVGAKLPTPTNPSENAQLGHEMMLAAGYGEDQWPCLYNLWMRESGWRTTAGNVSSGAYGIPQSLPASKMATYGQDYLTNPATQISWGLNYIKARYQTPCGAWNAFNSRSPHWY